MAARLMKFAVSKKGKSFIKVSLCLLGAGSMCANMLPYSVFLDKYQELYQLYKDKECVPVPESIKGLFEEVVTDLKSQLPMLYKVMPFMTYEFDIFNAGATYNRQGAIIGIPATFMYNSLNDVSEDKIMVANRPTKWHSDPGQKLRESLVLSDKAKKFAIAHEILLANTYNLWAQSLCPPFLLCVAIKFSELLREKLHLDLQSPGMRGSVYTIVGLIGCILWCLLHDRINVIYEMQTEKKLIELGRDYIEGGVEYYSKVLERNKALRTLLPEGPSTYTVTGNKPNLLRFPTVPFTARKQQLQELLGSNNAVEE